MLADDLDALTALGQTRLAYTDGTPEQQARLATRAAIVASLDAAIATMAPVVVAADFSSPDALSFTVYAARCVAIGTATKAALA